MFLHLYYEVEREKECCPHVSFSIEGKQTLNDI